MVFPDAELGRTDTEKRKAAEKLFSEQMKALSQLKSNGDATLIPVLVPYLNYTTDITPPLCHHTPS